MFYNPRYDRYVDEYAPDRVPPEARLEVTLLGAPLFAISFFWFGWTSFPSISFWSPLFAGGLMGFSIFLIFVGTSGLGLWSPADLVVLSAFLDQLHSGCVSFRSCICASG